jgi:hypothetical protein
VIDPHKLYQPLAVVTPAPLDYQRAGHGLSTQIHHPELSSGGEDGIRTISQRKERAVALEAVGFAKAAYDDSGQSR